VEAEDRRRADASYARLRHLQAISEAALAHLDFGELVDELLRRVTSILDTDTAAVLLLDEDARELVATAALGIEEEVEQAVRVPLGAGFAGRVAAERRTVSVPNIDEYQIYNPILREKGLRSLLGAPLLIQGRVIGVIHVGTLVPRAFTSDDAELLQAAADRVALAVDHARLYEAEHSARMRAEEAVEHLRRLESITEAALAHLSLDDLLESLLERLRTMIGSDTVAVMLVDDNEHELVTRAAVGLDEWLKERVSMTLGEGFSGRIASEARPAVLEDVQAEPDSITALKSSGIGALLGVPLVVGGRVTGVLTVGSWQPRTFSDEEVSLLQLAADRMALAIEHARLFDLERSARAEAEAAYERLRRIESITEVALHHLALDEDVIERLLSRVRTVLDADTAALYMADSGTQVLVARDGSGERVERGITLPEGGGFAGLVATRREPISVRDTDEVDIVSPLLNEARIRTLLGVPLIVEDRLVGVLFIGTLAPREFGPEHLSLLELAGERLGVALDRSRMYEREHFVAETLQRSLLPERLPDVQGVTVASRYLPGEGEAVGGDWYDVIPLRDGRVALAMGDVVSRGVRAASVMGQLRNALRAYALESYEPANVLGRLDAVARGMEGREMATLVYAVFDPSNGRVSYAIAGHPPPVVARPDGAATLLEEGRGPPLGALPDAVFDEAESGLAPGETLLLYTDGIVERRDMWVDEGITRLQAQMDGLGADAPDALLDRLIEALLGGTNRPADDVALLALQVDPATEGRFAVTLPADPTVLAGMRHTLRRWLGGVGAGEYETYDVLVATTEAAANAVEHAYGPGDATFEIEARSIGGAQVTVVVRDRGAWRPPRGHNRGRGTMLMQELMDEFEVTTGETGTQVRMSKRLAGVLAA
jgi:GAF domain-containing protein/anti-sigma regulatory factor (Ser/Thr protein kinase)